MSTLLERYIGGEYEQVWNELTAGLHPDGRPITEQEALPVAIETMRRVRQNLEVLVGRLTSLGYDFDSYPDGTNRPWSFATEGGTGPPLVPPPPGIEQELERFENLAGRLPLSLKAFWTIVGSVDLIGQFPDWEPKDCLDPLVVFPIDEAFNEYETWLERIDECGEDDADPLLVPLAPDDLHKDNVSGAGPYGIIVPSAGLFDAPFEQEWHATTFVNYLRICFHAGGFPGNSRNERPDIIEYLVRDLMPI